MTQSETPPAEPEEIHFMPAKDYENPQDLTEEGHIDTSIARLLSRGDGELLRQMIRNTLEESKNQLEAIKRNTAPKTDLE